MTDEMKPPPRLFDLPVQNRDDANLRALLDAGKNDLPTDDAMNRLSVSIGAIAGGGIGGAGGGGLGGATNAGAAKIIATKTGVSLGWKIAGGVIALGIVSGGTIAVVKSQRAALPVTTITETPTSISTEKIQTIVASPSAIPAASSPAPLSSSSSSFSFPSSSAPKAHVDDSPEAEVALLDRAQDSLRDNPSRALALTDEHRAHFGKGMLAEEREEIAIEALVKLNRGADADRRAAAFARAYPHSSHLPRLETVVGHSL